MLRRAWRQPSVMAPDDGSPRAAVASVFREGARGIELLFIERASKIGDPWSGQMAFPGGRVDPGDRDANHTAERETLEEVGLDLSGAERLGRLDDSFGGARRITVSQHGYWLDQPDVVLTPNHEVAEAVWLPLTHLVDPRNHVDYHWDASPHLIYPGITVLDLSEERSEPLGERRPAATGSNSPRVVWGMTYRMLTNLFVRLGHRLPPPPG